MKLRFRNFRHRSEDLGQLKADPENALHKRRAQVRKAQRTHRERKEAYTKALEAEVLHLRSNEANLLRETKTLYAEIKMLNDVLRVNGIQPASSTHSHTPRGPPEPESTVSIETYHSQKQLVVLNVVANHPQRKERALIPQRAASHALHKGQLAGTGVRRVQRIDYHKPWRDTMLPANACSSPSDRGAVSTCMRDQDATSIGVEFVLSLERPCLAHVQSALTDSSSSHGHVLTLSAPLLYQAPSGTASQADSHCWSVPKESLECLLKLSPNLSSTDEVTPIQAWDCIRRHPAFNALEADKLRSLAERLRQHVECHGFGAVVRRDLFQSLMDELVAAHVF